MALLGEYAYWVVVLVMMIGFFVVIDCGNLLKKLIGLNIFQTAIILFFIVQAYKTGASVPIWDARLGAVADAYVNPIPHGLMLTAIVVSVAITGVALALLIRIHRNFGTLDEPELLDAMKRSP